MTVRDIKTYVASLAERATGIEGFAAELGARELELVKLREEYAAKRAAAERNDGARFTTKAAPVSAPAKPPSRKAQARMLDELWDRLVDLRGGTRSMVARPPALPWDARGECLRIARDRKGQTAIRYAIHLPARQRSILMGLVARVGGWASRAGRRLVACAWATWRLSRKVVGGRRQRWGGGRVVDGFARQVWCLLVVEPDGSVPSLSTLWGTHCGSLHRPGPMALLRRAGLFTRIQPPASVARFVGPSGWAVGQMWYGRTNTGAKPPDDATAAQYGAELLELVSLL